ncbi:HigA family addiction module antitoxin [Duganella guangzhouensis]
MHNPAHPGEVLREYLDDLPLAGVAEHIGVSLATLQRIVDCKESIYPDLAYRLGAALGTSPDLWAGMQLQYDMYQAEKLPRPRIECLLPLVARP